MLQQLLICSSLAEMNGTYALQTSITCEELLEPVRNLHPLVSAALKNSGGEPSSFIRQQQEHAHTLHHSNQVPSDGQAQDPNCSGHDAHAHSDGHGQDGHQHGHNSHDAHAHTDDHGHDGLGHGHEHKHRVRTMASDMSTDDSDSICSSTMLDILIERNKLPQLVGTLSSSLLETQKAIRMTLNCGGSSCIKVPTCLTPPPASSSMMSKTACLELPSKQETSSRLKCRLKLKRPKTATDTSQAMEFSDENDEEVGHLNAKVSGSRNLACARRRRKQLNQKLFSLRALVPRITELDKASIVGDAIRHVRELQMQVEDMENDILSLQIDNQMRFEDERVDEASSHCANRGTDADNFWHNVPIHRILELSVSNLEENLYLLKVRCKNGPRVLVQLTKALEALNLNIINANIASMGNLVLNTVVFKVFNTDELLKPRELEERILETVRMFGFHF